MKKLIKISDVTARDGLQSLGKILSLKQKEMLISDLSKCGFDEIEVGSLVNYDIIPSMANSLNLYELFRNKKKISKMNQFYPNYYLLVGNNSGINLVNKNKICHISFFTSPSDTFNLKNINSTREESFIKLEEMISNIEDRESMYIKGYLSCIGSCPYEGDVPIGKIVDSVVKFKDIGVNEICLADTIGDLKKEKLEDILEQISRTGIWSGDKLSIHLHVDFESYYWKEVISVALKYNILKYDTSILNLGGCPAIYKKCNDDKLNGNLNIYKALEFFEDEGYDLNVNKQIVREVEYRWKDFLL